MRDFFEEMPIISGILALMLFAIMFFIVDAFGSKTEPFSGTVVDKHYKAEQTSTGTAYGQVNGQGAVMVTSHHESEKFILMVKDEFGKITTVEGSPEVYYEKEIGDEIQCVRHLGLFTGIEWGANGVK